MKRSTLSLTLGVLATLVLGAAAAMAQGTEPKIEVRITPAPSVEERVANDLKEKELRKAAEEKRAAEEAARIAETSPKALLSRARVLYIDSNTSYFEAVQLENALLKREETSRWQLAMVDQWRQRDIADVIVEIDRPFFTFTYTYKLSDRARGIVLATGKLTAIDSNAAAPILAERIVEEIRKARGELKKK